MAELRVFEFPGTIAMFGPDRSQAAALLEEFERKAAKAFPAVSYVQFSRSRDRAMLARRGIDVAGKSAYESVRGANPPSPEELSRFLVAWLDEQAGAQDEVLGDYAEERKRQNAEMNRRRGRERTRNPRDRSEPEGKGGRT